MPYIIRGGTHGGSASFPADTVETALEIARALREAGGDVSICDTSGKQIDGEELDACLRGEKTLTPTLHAERSSK